MKQIKKISKKGAIILAGLIVIGMVVSGAVISWYMNANTETGTIGDLLQYSVDDVSYSVMEELAPDISYSNVVPGDSETLTRYIQISSNINQDHTIKFSLINDTASAGDFIGTTLTLFDNTSGTPVEVCTCTDGATDTGTIVFSAGDKKVLELVLEVDNYFDTEEGTVDLTFDLLVERNAEMP